MQLKTSLILLIRFILANTGKQYLDPVSKQLVLEPRILGGVDDAQRRHFFKDTLTVINYVNDSKVEGDTNKKKNRDLLEKEFEVNISDKVRDIILKVLSEYEQEIGFLDDDKIMVDELRKVLI